MGPTFYGAEQTQLPLGDGFHCVAGTELFRLPVSLADPAGLLATVVDFTDPPSPAGAILAGSTWNFQAWYRDPAAGGAGSNLSDGLSVTFLP